STVGDGVGAGLIGDFHQTLGNQRTRNGSSQQVLAFIDSVRTEHGENEIASELFAQIVNIDFLHTQGLGLGTGRLHFLALPDISGKGHHLTLVGFLQPLDDYGGVQTSGISQNNLFDTRHAAAPITWPVAKVAYSNATG